MWVILNIVENNVVLVKMIRIEVKRKKEHFLIC